MSQYYDQQIVIANALPNYRQQDQALVDSACDQLWDPINARICASHMTWISAVPLFTALLIILSHAVRLLIPYRPVWLRPFVEELEYKNEGLRPAFRKCMSFHTAILLLLSLCGLLLQIYPLLESRFQFEDVSVALTWASTFLLITIVRPRVASKSLLLLYCTLSSAQAITVAQTHRGKFSVVQLILGLLSITTILLTPMRNPSLPNDEISPLFSAPTFELRSPEDNLTLWQFLSVSWMAPLISLGKKRQLNDEDVWSLSYEFQHRLLHDKFREVQGSLIGRLVKANCIDLILLGVLGILDLLANLAVPVLLQQLLRSMENLNAPQSAAITYAVLSLVARFISAQLGVLSLWNGRRAYERSRGEMITMLYEKTLARKIVGINEDAKESASMGKILNLMRNDAYEIAQRFWEFQSLVTKPLGLILSLILLWQIIGWPCLVGVLAVIIGQLANAVLARFVLFWERKRRAATDTKLQRVSQFVESIRHLRWYGWQDTWLLRIMNARDEELRLRVIGFMLYGLIQFTNQLSSGMFPVAAFYAYTALAGKDLRIDVAFPALQVFTMVEMNIRDIPGLITVILNARVSVGRIEDFLKEPDVDSYESSEVPVSNGHTNRVINDDTDSGPSTIDLKHASFAWPGRADTVLANITASFPSGLTVVCGEVGAGKTALLEALLGELDQKAGEIFQMKEAVGYCAQRPWLQSMSIRDNILFSAPYEESRYKKVLAACALDIDMANFEHGDRSNIGENGIGLSGGQRARVALARAVYSNARVLLLDDPISALDHQTAELVVNKCIGGDLMKGRTIILVTHRTELCHGLAKQILVVSNGCVRVGDLEKPFSDNANSNSAHKSADSTEDVQEPTGEAAKFMEDEYRAHGGVKATVYWEYIKAGRLRWWFVLICVMGSFRMADIGQSWFLKEWGEAYTTSSRIISIRGIFDRLPSPDVNITPWLVGYAIIALAKALLQLAGQVSVLIIIYVSGRQMFIDVMKCVSHATFRFYDVTPVGRLMNRLTSDISTIDGNISAQFQTMAFFSITWIISIVIIGSATPIFLACSVVFTSAFVAIFLYFLPTSQSLRRLEMVSLTPLMSNFGAIVEGLTTVRAFRAQHRFQDRVIAVTDNFQKMDHFYWSLQAWLSYRFDILSAGSTLLLTIVAIYSNVSPGLTAFVLIACANFVNATHSLCRAYGSLLMDFTSVERVVELMHLVQEPPGSIHPPASWPTTASDIVFEAATIRYAPHLDPALSDLSFRIKAGASTAVIGRTGSGKSTLAMALLATVLPESGRILIDNIDIAAIDKQALRERVTFVAQDPVLFPGTMRQNLDPLEEYSDEEREAVLAKIAGRHGWTLETEIEAGGRNLSQGQRQLIGLARTLLRRSSIVILDEATASIDKETAQSIQSVLHEEMKGRTVITIAHRLEAVKNAEYCVVLGKGRVVKQGRAEDILREESENMVEFEG